MKTLLKFFLINLSALWVTSQIITGLTYSGGLKTLILGGAVFTIINLILVPLIRILLLPLNLLTLGLFAWLTNVIALYALTTLVSGFRLGPFFFEGFVYNGFRIPPLEFSTFWTAVLASLLIGLITHFFQWLSH